MKERNRYEGLTHDVTPISKIEELVRIAQARVPVNSQAWDELIHQIIEVIPSAGSTFTGAEDTKTTPDCATSDEIPGTADHSQPIRHEPFPPQRNVSEGQSVEMLFEIALRQAHAGNWTPLVEATSLHILPNIRIKLRYTTPHDNSTIDDIFQTTWERLITKNVLVTKSITTYESFQKMFYRIAYNIALDLIRYVARRARWVSSLDALPPHHQLLPNHETGYKGAESGCELFNHILSMDPQRAALIILSYYLELTGKEIAELSNIASSNTAKVRVYRAKRALKECLS